MRIPLILLALCAGALAGCSKKVAPAATSEPQPTPEQAAQIESQYILPTNEPSALPVTPTAAQPQLRQRPQPTQQPIQQRLHGAVHAPLTIQLRQFVEKNGRMPASFAEFANSGMDSVPSAPAGMKFVIDPADQTVKAVKK